MRLVRFAAAAAALATVGTAASAVTIVQYRQLDGGPSIQLVNNGSSSTLSSIGSQNVRITLFDPMDANNSTFVDGTLTFSAMGNNGATVVGNNVLAEFASGFFSLTANSSFSFLGSTGTNVLSGSFTNGVLTGILDGLAPTFSVSIPQSSITGVTSAFFNDPMMMVTNFSIGMSDADPSIGVTNGQLNSFTAASVGTFGAGPSVVPEPATWAMMILGFGLVGSVLRRKSPVARVSA